MTFRVLAAMMNNLFQLAVSEDTMEQKHKIMTVARELLSKNLYENTIFFRPITILVYRAGRGAGSIA